MDSIKHLLIGGIAGIFSRTLTAPLELSKIQKQNNYMPYSSLGDVLRKEGVFGLWKGNFSNCIRIFPQTAINFTIFEYNKKMLSSYIENRDVNNFISGGIGGMTAIVITYPLENARSRLSLQTNNDHYKNLVDVFRKTSLKELYNGLRMSIFGFTPYNALNFMFYNKYKSLLNNNGYENYLVNMLSGGFAGMSAVTFTYPTDLIRRRLQLQGFDPKVPKYDGILDCIKKIYMLEGIRGLYRGLLMCYIKIFPSLAIQFFIIDLGKELI